MNSVAVEDLLIAIHESALDEMHARLRRLNREKTALVEDIAVLRDEIEAKQSGISAARDVFLRRCAK